MAAIPLFREDSLAGAMQIVTEMLETKEILVNRTNCRVTAWLVPFLAFKRFNGSRDEFDRSYMGEASLNGDGVIPFVENYEAGPHGFSPILKSLGLHCSPGDQISTGYREAYNLIINHRCRQLSEDLPQRDLDDETLAPAFWQHGPFEHIVAKFDQAIMQGEVALNVVAERLKLWRDHASSPGRGQYKLIGRSTDDAVPRVRDSLSGGDRKLKLGINGTAPSVAYDGGNVNSDMFWGSHTGLMLDMSDVYAELAQDGITVSLADIDNARKVQAFAKLRERFDGHDDDYIIDMLMQGLTIPDQHLKQPIPLADRTWPFRQAKRYATDSGNLDDSAVSGAAIADLRLRVPRINTGGIVMVMVEYLPQQLWERQQDWYLHSRPKDGQSAQSYWPDAERDSLDPEKVDVVYNDQIDTSHTNPTGYFGFEPMNGKYTRARSAVGGKFFRPAVDTAFDEARQRLWAVEGADPALTDDFFIAGDGVHRKVFLDEVSDPFELTAQGNCVINGNTQFGGVLIEATGNYDAVAAKVPSDRIEQEA